MTTKVNGKERTIKEEIFDKSSDRIARLVNKGVLQAWVGHKVTFLTPP